jgi:hypothetical protein
MSRLTALVAAPAGWRGSAVAFHAGTRHPQNPPDKGGQAGTDADQFKPEGILAVAANIGSSRKVAGHSVILGWASGRCGI